MATGGGFLRSQRRRSGPEVKTWEREGKQNCGNEKPQPGRLGQD